MYLSHIFLDKHYPWIGLASNQNKHFVSGVMVVFSHLDFSPTKIFCDLDTAYPLVSAVDIAARYSPSVLVFTDRPGDIDTKRIDHTRVHVLPCSAIPRPILEKMATFDIDHYRYDDRPGD